MSKLPFVGFLWGCLEQEGVFLLDQLSDCQVLNARYLKQTNLLVLLTELFRLNSGISDTIPTVNMQTGFLVPPSTWVSYKLFYRHFSMIFCASIRWIPKAFFFFFLMHLSPGFLIRLSVNYLLSRKNNNLWRYLHYNLEGVLGFIDAPGCKGWKCDRSTLKNQKKKNSGAISFCCLETPLLW